MFSASTALVASLWGLAGAAGGVALLELARPAHWQRVDRWRDPAPTLFRLLLPVARLGADYLPARLGQDRRLQQRLDRAGIGYALLPSELWALRGLTALVGAALTLAVLSWASLSPTWQWVMAIGLPIVGFYYPEIWLRDHGRRRQVQIARQFPALLELLGLSVRAGLSFSAALAQSSAQLEPGPLNDEFQRLAREMRTGMARQQALQRLADRIDLAAVHSFVAAIVQADETGAAVSQALNDQAAQRRQERFAVAEKKANEAPVKMLLPLVGLLFPVAFLIIGFPIVLQFMDGGLL